MRLLIVEDDPGLSSMLRRAMRRAGWAVDLADSGTDALWTATEEDHDAVVMGTMVRHAGHARTRAQLLDAVWDSASAAEGTGSTVVDVYVRHLREKVDRPFGREDVATVRGVGHHLG